MPVHTINAFFIHEMIFHKFNKNFIVFHEIIANCEDSAEILQIAMCIRL